MITAVYDRVTVGTLRKLQVYGFAAGGLKFSIFFSFSFSEYCKYFDQSIEDLGNHSMFLRTNLPHNFRCGSSQLDNVC